MRKTLALFLVLLLAAGGAQAQRDEPLAAAVKLAGKQLVWTRPPRQPAAGRHNWLSVLRLPNGTPVKVLTRDGVEREGHLGDATDERIILVAVSQLPRDARDAVVDLATNRPGHIGRQRRFTHGTLEVTESGVFFDGIHIADADTVFVEISRDAIAEVKRPSRGSGPGAFAGFMTGFVVGIRNAVNLGFKQCGGSCNDEKALAFLSVTALPLATSYLGRRFVPHPKWTTAYRSR